MASPSTARIEQRNPATFVTGQLLFLTRLLLMVVSLSLSLLLHNIWRIIGKNSPWPRLFLLSISWTSGIATATTGTRVRSNVFYAANHHSWIDIPVMSGVTGCTFVANDGIESWPLIGWLCKINNTIFVNRENRASVSTQVDDLRAAMAGDQPVTIFPEGTTHDGSGLLPFKPSLFAALVPPPEGMLVQPVYLNYGHHTPRVAWVGDEKVTENFWRLLSYLKPITATLHFLEPFDPLHYPDRKAISAEVRARIGAAMEGGGNATRLV
ncbi:lysophospholipid acyltransferase family protein [Sphingorhabdus wooponensis]|jgi:1-acyl-sn-glycerol-3-phosphate acyltransferase|uniref:1-acyl-sn-glycerol-3-phosphate acyltransferase n=1 Tax=Sphingorhabdus wooponensis TaxID=940136 RepID=A0A3R8WL30_9SPHN|nr:lysophospholipid acyltransferase family protein [Sphingorhabdus wooponensis]RRQ52398.1 1-acyl-sn-glycerol-3-phosphate acyltransferase [Sphingorhabdus wooponensis]